MPITVPGLHIRLLYDRFDEPLTSTDCGQLCAPHNPTGLPFCCDPCQAVPAAYLQEWDYMQAHTGQWHLWGGDECPSDSNEVDKLWAQVPEHMLLLACQGPVNCRREFRLTSCRQFPFFPYITSRGRFLGLAYDWEYEPSCWVISHLSQVRAAYRQAFVRLYDALFSVWEAELESYALRSEEMRAHFAAQKRRIPILHRSAGYFLLSPKSERLHRTAPERLPRFGIYR